MESRLRPLAQLAIDHWKEFLPRMYAELKASGQLNKEALSAAEKTLDEQARLIEQGLPPEAAWEIVRELHLFRPEEDGASEEAPDSEGYLLNLKLNRLLSSM